MSHAAGINIPISSSTKSILELIEVFLNNGWSVKDHGHISYLPLGDEDAFNWQHIAMAAWPKISNRSAKSKYTLFVLTVSEM